MNDTLNNETKSFKLIRPKNRNGTYKPMVSYTKKLLDVLYLNLATSQEELFKGLYCLFGPSGIKKSFKRYYYPKRYIWTSTLFVKPRVMNKIDDKTKLAGIRKYGPDFNGVAKNKIIDKRNLIVDFTDIFELVIPNEFSEMIKSTVVAYVENIYPELMCYVLFKNDKHDKENDIETSEESLELPKVTKENLLEFAEESDLLTEFKELSDEEWESLVTTANRSIEAFTEKLMAKTQMFSMGGPAIGLSQYGFDKFIISIPYTLKSNTFVTMQYIQSRIVMPRNVKKNPNLIYQLSLIQFVYKCIEAFSTGSSSNPFISEIIKRDVTFHFYCETGLGFVLNLKEIRDYYKYKSNQVARLIQNRLQMMTLCNTGVISDKELDEIEKESVRDEVDHYFQKEQNLDEKNDKNELKNDLKEVFKADLALKTVITSKNEEKIEVIDKIDNPKTEVNFDKTKVSAKDHSLLNNIANSLSKLENTFKKTKTTIISDNKEEAQDITITSQDYDDILNNNDGNTEDQNTPDDEIVEDTTEIEEVVDEINEETNLSSDFKTDDDDFLDNGTFEDKYAVDEEIVDEETDEDEGYTEIKPKTNQNGPIKIKEIVTKEVVRSPAEEKRIQILKDKYKSIELDGTKIADIIGKSSDISIKSTINPEVVPNSKDPSIVQNNLSSFQESYNKQNYQPDIINAVRSLSINKSDPLYIVGADVKDTSDQFTDKYTYKFVLEDEHKIKHNLTFDVPKINSKGMIKIGGNEKYLKKQLIRKPIVKISPDKVYVTTQLNSYQVMRTGLFLNKGSEVIRRLFSEYFDDNPKVKIERGNCETDNIDYLTTLEYDSLAKSYFLVKINDEESKFGEHVEIYFSQKVIRDRIKKYGIPTGYENNELPPNILPIAINYTKKMLYSIDTNRNNSVNTLIVGIFDQVLGDKGMMEFVKKVKTPKRRMCTKIEIQSFTVPLIAFLNYLFGWERVKSYFPENEIEFSETPIKNTNKLSIRFYNGYLYYNQYPIRGSLFLNGLTEIDTENYNYEDLDNQGLYINYTYDKFKTRNIVKGWVTAKENMLDLKTLQILEALKLPTDFLEIFLYCNDLLVDNQVKSESDISNYRIRSNEIISECIYKVINDCYMTYKKKNGKTNKISIPDNAVLAKVYKTEILEGYDAISPVGELRALGLTTFKGPGGTKVEQAFTLKKRAFDKSYYGLFGISTPDNLNSGVTKELTANPNILNTLGFIGEPSDKKSLSINDIAPLAEAITPYATRVDDPKRISFISGQNNHVGGMLNSSIPPVRTGLEKVVSYNCSENFSQLSKKDGVVTDIDEVAKKVYLSYKDGTKDVIDYNNRMLRNSDAFNQASYKCQVKVGQKVKAKEVICADERFFKKDPLTGELLYTQSVNAMVAIMENTYTEDDSNLITDTFANKLKMDFTKRKQISIKPMDTIIEYKNIGDHVKLGDPLFVFDQSGTFEEENSDDAEDSMYKLLIENLDVDTVSQMIHQTPKSPINGTISDIRVYWTVPYEKMSKTVAKFVKNYVSKINKEIKDEETFTGKTSEKRKLIEITKVDISRNRINGAEVDRDGGIVIEYFISHDDTMSTGDKITLNSSLKTVNAFVVPREQEPYTETGSRIDGIFSLLSIGARMVNSVWYNGWIGMILYKFSKRWAKNFLKEIGEDIPENDREVKIS